jgi:single-strand DNA-binding protein
MASFNKVILLGNLTRDPQLSYLPSQTAVIDFGMAMNRKWKAQDGTMKEDTCFVDCRCFGKQAETINKFCKKGNPLFVEGRLTFDSWTAQDGKKMSKLRVTVEAFQFVGAPNQGGQGGRTGQAPAPQNAAPQEEEMGSFEGNAPPNDDIPF